MEEKIFGSAIYGGEETEAQRQAKRNIGVTYSFQVKVRVLQEPTLSPFFIDRYFWEINKRMGEDVDK